MYRRALHDVTFLCYQPVKLYDIGGIRSMGGAPKPRRRLTAAHASEMVSDMSSEERMFVEAVHHSNLLQHILARSSALPGEVMERLSSSSQGKEIVKAWEELQTDCYLCLSNITDMMTITQLGGGEAVKTVWLSLCSSLCSTSTSLHLLESLSCAVRSLTSQLCRPDDTHYVVTHNSEQT